MCRMAERTYTPEQIKLIEHGEGHAVVSAVAGSGKTETQRRTYEDLRLRNTSGTISKSCCVDQLNPGRSLPFPTPDKSS